MDLKIMDRALVAIAEKRNELSALTYDDNRYDDLEEALHDLEDSFNNMFGDELEDVLADIHDELCPDSDVLLPTAYMAKKYVVTASGYATAGSQGVPVEADDYLDKKPQLVLIPSPLRIELLLMGKTAKVLWAPLS